MSDNIEWYLARDGQQHGPLTQAELDKFIELGHLRAADLLWRAGFDDWRPAAEVFPPRPPVASKPPPDNSAPAAANPTLSAPSQPADLTTNPGLTARLENTAGDLQQTAPISTNSDNRSDPALRAPGPSGISPGQTQPGMREPHLSPDARTGGEPSLSSPSAATRRPEPMGGPAPVSSHTSDPRTPHASMAPAPVRPSRGQDTYPTPSSAPSAADPPFPDEIIPAESSGRGGWLAVAAALFVFVILGAGGLFAYNNQKELTSLVASLTGSSSSSKSSNVTVVRAPREATREAVDKSSTPAPAKPEAVPTQAASLDTKPAAPTTSAPLPELPILKSKLWQFAQAEFSEWANTHLTRVRELSAQDKSREETNNYLVNAFVQFRRDNAAVALLAAPSELQQVASAFVESLRALTAKGPDACYAFISNGESTPEVAPLYFEPSVGPKLEAQMLTIMQAIAAGKATPTSSRQPPTAEDFNKLSVELGKRGWTANDLRLFSDPNALSKAKPEVVCRLVTEWFATQTRLADEKTRDQLIAASLRPVIGG